MSVSSAPTRANWDKRVTTSCIVIFSPQPPILPAPSIGEELIYAFPQSAMCHIVAMTSSMLASSSLLWSLFFFLGMLYCNAFP